MLKPDNVCAQNETRRENSDFSYIIENIIESTEDDNLSQDLLDEVNDLIINPLDINIASADELKRIYYLNDFQINSIINYRQEFGNILSLNELLLIPGFQADLLQKIYPFIKLNYYNEELNRNFKKNIISYDHIVRFKYKPEIPAGFTTETDSLKRFIGSRHYMLSRQEISINKKIKGGLLIEKDAGEAYFSYLNAKLPDHITGYLEFQGDKKLRKLIIGDFRAGFGQGLVYGNSYRLKNINAIISPGRDYLKKSLSASESGFNRGIASVLRFGRLTSYAFVSLLSCDAIIKYRSGDSDSIAYFTSINTSGLHRNISENQNRNTVCKFNSGINMVYSFNKLSLGLIAVNTIFNPPKETSIYEKSISAPAYINKFSNFGFHYRASLGKVIIFGEIATDYSANTALINGFMAQPHPLVSFSLIQRYYSPEYISFSSGLFAKSSGTRNEAGTYIAVNFYPLSFLNLSIYADHYTFPRLRSGIPSPYQGSEYYVNAFLNLNSENIITIRYKTNVGAVKKNGIQQELI